MSFTFRLVVAVLRWAESTLLSEIVRLEQKRADVAAEIEQLHKDHQEHTANLATAQTLHDNLQKIQNVRL